jgi:MSHA biogenesis protein MshI
VRRFFQKSVPGKLGLEVSPFGVAAAYLAPSADGGLDAGSCAYFGGSAAEEHASLLQWIEDRSIEQVRTQVVLHPTMYNIYFVDRPAVEDSELAEAVQWKIKDLVEQPLKDLIVDAFPVPEDAYRGSQKKVYAVSIAKSLLEDTVAQLNKLPIKLEGISISELADRAMLNRFYEDRGGAALLRLRSSHGTINLIDGGDLYLTRIIESGVSSLEVATDDNRQQVMDELLLEVQRCLDFYDSQLGKGAIRKMLVAPTRLSQNFFDEHLRGYLDLSVDQLDLNESFKFEEPLSGDLQSVCFGAVSAASALSEERAS